MIYGGKLQVQNRRLKHLIYHIFKSMRRTSERHYHGRKVGVDPGRIAMVNCVILVGFNISNLFPTSSGRNELFLGNLQFSSRNHRHTEELREYSCEG